MTTWSMDTVRKVQRLGITFKVAELAEELGDGIEQARREMARQIVEAARTFAVEVHPDDVAAIVRESPADREERRQTRIITLDGRWEPGWRNPTRRLEVELRGGYHGGRTIQVWPQDLEPGVHLAIPHTASYAVRQVEMAGVMPDPDVQHYELVGWNEQDRRWVLSWT
jgi:hypothetical protein